MSITTKIVLTYLTSKSGKRLIIEDEVKQVCFPEDVWNLIKGYMIDNEPFRLARIIEFSLPLRFRFENFSGNIIKKMDDDDVDFEELSQNPRWKKKCLQWCKISLRKARENLRSVERSRSWLNKIQLQDIKLERRHAKYALEDIEEFKRIYNNLKFSCAFL